MLDVIDTEKEGVKKCERSGHLWICLYIILNVIFTIREIITQAYTVKSFIRLH